jgi:carbon monoxide dehydrogenase subunit G
MEEKKMKKLNDRGKEFEIHGAGFICVSNSITWETGMNPKRIGFDVSVKFVGDANFSGGVLTKEDAKKLADHIYDCLEGK